MPMFKLKCEDSDNAEIALMDFFVDIEADANTNEYSCFYEHGQLWIEHLPCGAQWSVNDLEDQRPAASQRRERAQFCFEMTAAGDGFCSH